MEDYKREAPVQIHQCDKSNDRVEFHPNLNGRAVLTIYADGRIRPNPDLTYDEAATAFLAALPGLVDRIKAEGYREGIEAAAKLCEEEAVKQDNYANEKPAAEALYLAEAIRTLLQPAPSEDGESGKVGG